jgi:hypothetical protein
MIYRVFLSTRVASYKNVKRGGKNERVKKRPIRMGEKRNDVSQGVENRFICNQRLC